MTPSPTSAGPVAAIVLAAGESRRFGSAKQLAPLAGRTLLEHVLDLAYTAGLRPVVAVVPVWLTRPASADEDVIWVRNPYPSRGMSHSLRLGFGALTPAVDAAVILLGDQPTVAPDSIATVLAARGERPIIAAWADGRPAPPVCIERSHFGIVEEAAGDRGLRDLLLEHPEWVAAIEIPSHAPDIDRQADLDQLETDL
jgi:molybdenum cofactor cytidylyltransferase